MKLLIAEDDLTSRMMLTAISGKWGHEVIAVEDGEAAWQVLQVDDSPRLLLLDWEMPKLDGLGLCRRIREQKTTDPPYIILLTARSETDDIVKGLDAGANDYIAKPYENIELQARLEVGKRMLNLQEDLNLARETLAFQASHDMLTGLENRRAVLNGLEREVARTQRQQETLFICLCDIDHFKNINDSYGHLIGDAVLREVAERMKATLRPYDHLGRYGGEEFLIVLNGDSDQIENIFERIRSAIADKPFIVEQQSLDVTVSLGVSMFHPGTNQNDSMSLVAAADEALYKAKNKGRNQVMFAEMEMQQSHFTGQIEQAANDYSAGIASGPINARNWVDSMKMDYTTTEERKNHRDLTNDD